MESGAVTPEADEGGNVFANDGKRKGMDDEGRRERERRRKGDRKRRKIGRKDERGRKEESVWGEDRREEETERERCRWREMKNRLRARVPGRSPKGGSSSRHNTHTPLFMGW